MNIIRLLCASLLLIAACAVEESEQAVESAATSGYVITDIVIVASNGGSAPVGPSGYDRIGYWDVDDGGGYGTNGQWGEYMFAMYAKKRYYALTSTCVDDLYFYASDASSLPSSIGDMSLVGMWDVDGGGAWGGGSSYGSYMGGLYVRKGYVSNNNCILDLKLAASNSSSPPCYPGYDCVGGWDMDDGGGFGNYGGGGDWMMVFSSLSE